MPSMVLLVVAHPQPQSVVSVLEQVFAGDRVQLIAGELDEASLVDYLRREPRLIAVVASDDYLSIQSLRRVSKQTNVSVRLLVAGEVSAHELKQYENHGFKTIFSVSDDALPSLQVVFTKMPADYRDVRGSFDIIGDIHGCLTETLLLLEQLGYMITPLEEGFQVTPPPNRKVIFLGDLGDRGPDTPGVCRLVMDMIDAGQAYCVLGNHDFKLWHHLSGKTVKRTHGFESTLAQFDKVDQAFKDRVLTQLEAMPTHMVLDGGALVVCHAGLPQEMHLRKTGKVKSRAVFGKTTGEYDERGYPIRVDWAKDYTGDAVVVYGHTPIEHAEWVNNTICLDTGCVFGGKLTALRWPERDLVQVPAERVYYVP
jgi:predicted phosphodiesterase